MAWCSGVSKDWNSSARANSRMPVIARLRCRFSARFVDWMACGGWAANRCARAIASSSSLSPGTTRLASPIDTATAAGMRSPVNRYSFARSKLMSSGQVGAPPSAAVSPTDTCGSER